MVGHADKIGFKMTINDGYYKVENFLEEQKLKDLESILQKFHKNWLLKNKEFYEKSAINSAYISSKQTTSNQDRQFLFNLISSTLIKKELEKIFIDSEPCFLNTQLFFSPFNPQQKNYWHRDIQYTGLSLNDQKKALRDNINNVIHFRIAIKDEDGIELIPQTNKRWDTTQEFEVRNNLNQKNHWDELPNSKKISLSRGDLLVFSANMIHRGLYSKNRFAFDILFCEPDPKILSYIDDSCYPEKLELNNFENPALFSHYFMLEEF